MCVYIIASTYMYVRTCMYGMRQKPFPFPVCSTERPVPFRFRSLVVHYPFKIRSYSFQPPFEVCAHFPSVSNNPFHFIFNSQWWQPVPVGVTTKRRPSWGFEGLARFKVNYVDGVVRNRTTCIYEKVGAQLREAR